jgi:tRNA(fMet)-specific endonuclease VapC
VISTALPILPYDAAAAEWQGKQRARLSKLGLTPAFVDGQIAAVAAVHDLILVTDNVRDFEHYSGLRVERWHRIST